MGLIHIYCGDGKGKTSAAIGLAIRAVGSGMKVHFVQLLKGNETSEINTLKLIPNISVARCAEDYGFTFTMTEKDKKNISDEHNHILSEAISLACSGSIDMLIIDEFNVAYEYGLLDKELAQKLVLNKPQNLELILTGRNPAEKFVEVADYVSEIKAVKHPFMNGIVARQGIEF